MRRLLLFLCSVDDSFEYKEKLEQFRAAGLVRGFTDAESLAAVYEKNRNAGIVLKEIAANYFTPEDVLRDLLSVKDISYAGSHESDPTEISDGFKELDKFLEGLSLDDNNAVWNLCCQLCTAYEHKAFLDGLRYGAYLVQELNE